MSVGFSTVIQLSVLLISIKQKFVRETY